MALVPGSDVEMSEADACDTENEEDSQEDSQEVEDIDDFQNVPIVSDLQEVPGIMEVTNEETPYLLAPKWPLFDYLKKRDDKYEKILRQVVMLLSHKRNVNCYFEKLKNRLKIVKRERNEAQSRALLNHRGAMQYYKKLVKARKALARSQRDVMKARRQLVSGKKLLKKTHRDMQLMRRSVLQAYEVASRAHGKSATTSTSRTT